MFGFGKKKESPKASERARRSEEFEQRKAQNKAQLGMFMGFDDAELGGSVGPGSLDVADDELENELLQLLGDDVRPQAKGRPQAASAPANNKGKQNINFSLEEGSGGEEDDDGDLDDPELEAELGEILGGGPSEKPFLPLEKEDDEAQPEAPKPTMSASELSQLLKERLLLYEQAKSAAEKAGDSGKVRRFTRGIKTLKELEGKARVGRVVDESEIPPAVSVGVAGGKVTPAAVPSQEPEPLIQLEDPPAPPVPPPRRMEVQPVQVQANPPPEPPVDYKVKQEVSPAEPPVDYDTAVPVADEAGLERLKEYKKAAVILKRNGEVATAVHYLKLSKQLETLLNTGGAIDLSQFPPVLPQSDEASATPPVAPSPPSSMTQAPLPEVESAEGPPVDIFHAPPPPSSVLEALQQRLEKYQSEVEKATAASNSGKARRMGRIVKQYEEAISLYKKGKPVPYDELPTPPGFAPIPVGGPAPDPAGAGVVRVPPPTPPKPAPSVGGEDVSPEKRQKPAQVPSSSPSSSVAGGPSTSIINRAGVGGKPMTKLTLQEKQLREVLLRQKQYKDAALEAKKRGDINQAREYLRISKGFDNLVEVSKSGLPVDLKTLPAPPDALLSLEAEDFELVSDQDCIVPKDGDLTEVFAKLEEDLKAQLKMCMRTRDHFKSIGDVASANRFEGMALDTKRDLDAVRLAARAGTGAPKYHYENRVFAITDCNTDIKDDEIEITVVRGINYKSSSSIDTFLRVELPYPSAEEAQSQKSGVVKDSVDPEYNATYKMSVNRGARNFQRFIHRHGVKVEVWSKGGFLRSSSIFGIATVKLAPLETKTTLHDAFDILDGRKPVGKLEVKIRLRDPVVTKQITQRKEKWLSIDRA